MPWWTKAAAALAIVKAENCTVIYYKCIFIFIYYAKWQHKYIYGKIRKRNTQLQY